MHRLIRSIYHPLVYFDIRYFVCMFNHACLTWLTRKMEFSIKRGTCVERGTLFLVKWLSHFSNQPSADGSKGKQWATWLAVGSMFCFILAVFMVGRSVLHCNNQFIIFLLSITDFGIWWLVKSQDTVWKLLVQTSTEITVYHITKFYYLSIFLYQVQVLIYHQLMKTTKTCKILAIMHMQLNLWGLWAKFLFYGPRLLGAEFVMSRVV